MFLGENAYNQKLYGKRIIVHRTISASGGGTYRLRNEHGKVVVEKRVREELDRILSCFNIQIENPIGMTFSSTITYLNISMQHFYSFSSALLTQDTAKTFLFKCQPEKLYEFFMKATQLEECKTIIKETVEELQKARSMLALKTENFGNLQKERDSWKKKYDFYKKLQAR